MSLDGRGVVTTRRGRGAGDWRPASSEWFAEQEPQGESAMNIRHEDFAHALVSVTFAVATMAMWVVVFAAT